MPKSRTLPELLEPLRDEFDRVCHEAGRQLSHQDYDRLEERAQVVSAGIRAAFRGARR